MSHATPRVGRPVRGSSTGRPIMVLLDQFGRRWTLRILWELRGGPLTFRELQDACDDASPSVLNTRLRELRALALIVHEAGSGYALSPHGQSLLAQFAPLQAWAERWAADSGPSRPKIPPETQR
ncbi:MAG: helix-turn-helix domain-containing protein [Oceanococcaceae bacterium]